MNPEKNSIFQDWVSCANFSIHFQATVFQPCIRAFHITSIPMIANSHLDCRGFLIHIYDYISNNYFYTYERGGTLGSTVLNMEFDIISDKAKKANIMCLAKIIDEIIIYSPEILQRAIELKTFDTIQKMDSLHIASAEIGHADVFLSTDDKLLKACRRMQDKLKIKVKNPLFYLAEVNEQ